MFARHSDYTLVVSCRVVTLLRQRAAEILPGVHVSQFVSEAGLRRGLALSRYPLPDTFVLLAGDPNPGEMTPDQAKMLEHCALVYVGKEQKVIESIGMEMLVPLSDAGYWEDQLNLLKQGFEKLVEQACADACKATNLPPPALPTPVGLA